MADIETSVVISAQTDDLQSGMEAAANSVQAATEGMKAQFAGLSAAAQQAQSQISATVAQIGATIGTLQSKVASVAGSIGDGMVPNVAAADGQRLAGSGRQGGVALAAETGRGPQGNPGPLRPVSEKATIACSNGARSFKASSQMRVPSSEIPRRTSWPSGRINWH